MKPKKQFLNNPKIDRIDLKINWPFEWSEHAAACLGLLLTDR